MRDDMAFVAMGWLISAAVAVVVIGTAWAVLTRDHYPQSSADCPPDHVYIDYGETPQVGCWPEGVARELGVWPWP